MKLIPTAVATSIITVAALSSAHADIETVQVPLSAIIQDTTGEVTFSYTLPLFNTQGGSRLLSQVDVTGTAIMGTRVTGVNNSVFPLPLSVRYSAGISGVLPGGAFSAFQTDLQSEPFLLPTELRRFDFLFQAPIQASLANPSAFASPTGGTSTQSGTFTAFLELPTSGQTQWIFTPSLLGGSLTVQYTYQVIPAPSAALTIGLASLITHRRRRS